MFLTEEAWGSFTVEIFPLFGRFWGNFSTVSDAVDFGCFSTVDEPQLGVGGSAAAELGV